MKAGSADRIQSTQMKPVTAAKKIDPIAANSVPRQPPMAGNSTASALHPANATTARTMNSGALR